MKFGILTFGCKVNQGESENIVSNMIKNGYEFSESNFGLKVIIINSCTVTAESDRKLRQSIRKLRNQNPDSILILTGCMPQAFPELASKFEEVQIVVGNSKKECIPELINKYIQNKKPIFEVEDIFKVKKFKEISRASFGSRLRAFLKIEDGCDRFCSYCIIPYARGTVRSKKLEEIEKDSISLSKNGYKEIVLTGINLSSYGKDLNLKLEDAIKKISSIPEVKRIRLGSLEPDLVTEGFINSLSREVKICPQFHLSLQSGSNKVLESMRRKYNKEGYLNVVNLIKRKIPFATFTTDLMIGFPGETNEDFEESLKLVEEVGFLKVHVFPYSVRPGTIAAKLNNQIDGHTKTKRVQKAIDISKKISKIVIEGFKGLEMDVLYESYENGFYKGYTPNYILVKSECSWDVRGKILKTLLTYTTNGEFCLGKIIEER